jgi:uncharacterized OB-fold protein
MTDHAPAASGLSAPFWAAAAEGRLVLQRCDGCTRFVWYPRAICPACGSTSLTWSAASGTGTVYAVSVHHRPSRADLADVVPYAVVLVDLDEGVRMMARVAPGHPPDEVAIGQRVHWLPDPAGGREFVFGPA